MVNAELQEHLSAESQTLLAAFPEAVVLVTPAGIIVACNALTETLFGYPPQALLGQPLARLLPERSRGQVLAHLPAQHGAACVDAGDTPEPLAGLRSDGTKFPLIIQCRPCPLAQAPLHLVVLRPVPVAEVARALETSAQRFQQVIDLVPHFIFAKDMDGRFIVVNRATAEAYGTTVAALLGKRDADFATAASEVEHFRADDLAVMHSGQAKIIPEEQITDAQGQVRILSTLKIPFTFSGTTLPAVLGVSVDITASKAQERALEASRRFAQQITHTMPGIVYLYDLSTHQTVYANDCLQNLLGFTPEDVRPIEGETLRTLMHPDDWRRYRVHVHRLLQSRDDAVLEFEGRLRHADGSWIWLLTRDLVFSRHADGSPHLLLGVAHDFTARKQMEAALRENEAHHRQLFHLSPIGQALIQPDGTILEANPAYARLHGRTVEETLGLNYWALLLEGTREGIEAALQQLTHEESIGPYEVMHQHKHGHPVPVRIYGILRRNGDDVSMLCSIEDITEQKQAEAEATRRAEEICRLNAALEQRVEERTAQLAASNRELEAFCYSVSHDLRAPLRAINGFSQAFLEEYGAQLTPEGQHYLQRVRAGSQRMALLIDDLLNLSHLTRHEMCYARVHLSALVANIAAELHATQPQRQVTWRITPELYADADASLIRIALGNLLSNAWKYTGKRAEAHITFDVTTVQGQRAYLVRDNGAGFDMAYASKLFGAFQRLHRPDEFEGTGIGLATVERIIHRHGGQVWAESTVEHGATFYFTLPHAAASGVALTGAPRTSASSDRLC